MSAYVKSNSGQTLITLLIFMIMAITVTTAIVGLTITNTKSISKYESSIQARNIAESGAENAVIRLLRNPAYTGETMTIGDGTATISVDNRDPIYATSTARINNFVRKVQVAARYVDGLFTILSWKEIF